MEIPIDLVIPIIMGALISIIINSNRVTKRILAISTKLVNAYYSKQEKKLLELYKNTNDPFEILSLSNEAYKLDFVKKPTLILIIYLIIYNAIIITGAVILYILSYNVILYIISGFVTNILTILFIKTKQKIKARGGSQQQHVT
jgi:hypothetical protein